MPDMFLKNEILPLCGDNFRRGFFVQKIYRNILEIREKRNIIEMFKIELFEREESVC